MDPSELKNRNLEQEFIFSASRSSGPGGQNVNKVSSRVELRFNLLVTSLFSDEEKEIMYKKLKNRINKEGEILIVSQTERSQQMNKVEVIDKFYEIVAKALTLPKKRRPTRPTLSSKIKRLDSKRIRGSIKKLRKDSGEDSE
jgi:ribosome-associated protein